MPCGKAVAVSAASIATLQENRLSEFIGASR
jgi:hypothetical protein